MIKIQHYIICVCPDCINKKLNSNKERPSNQETSSMTHKFNMYLLYPVPSSKVLLMWIYALTRIIPCSEHCLMYVSDMWRANQSSVCRTPQVILTILWGLLGDSSQIFNPSLSLSAFSPSLSSLSSIFSLPSPILSSTFIPPSPAAFTPNRWSVLLIRTPDQKSIFALHYTT